MGEPLVMRVHSDTIRARTIQRKSQTQYHPWRERHQSTIKVGALELVERTREYSDVESPYVMAGILKRLLGIDVVPSLSSQTVDHQEDDDQHSPGLSLFRLVSEGFREGRGWYELTYRS